MPQPDSDPSLCFATVEQILRELRGRYDSFVFAGVMAHGDTKDHRTYAFNGDMYQCVAIAERVKSMAMDHIYEMEDESEESDEIDLYEDEE